MKKFKSSFDGARALMVIHLVLVLLIPFLFTQMGGCKGPEETVSLNLGPAITAEEIDKAIGEPLKNSTPLSIQLGEGFIFSETQELGVNGAFAVISDTSQTVIEKSENSTEILMTLIEHKQVYSNGNVQKTSTEIPLRIEKPQTEQMASASSPNSFGGLMFGPEQALSSLDQAAQPVKPKFRAEVEALFRERSPYGLLNALRSGANKINSHLPFSTNSKPEKNSISVMSESVTYHGLKTSMSIESPPALVQKRDNCAGLPDCKLRVYKIEFDMVFWENGKPDRVHWNLDMSPDAPYLAGLLNKCVTGLAPLGGNQGEVLVKQCMPVVDFRFTN